MTDKLRKAYRFATVPEHLIRDKAMSDRAVRLWCLLDRYAGKDDSAFPSRETLSQDLGCSRASVDRAVNELVTRGWLSKDRRYAGGVNEYTLLIAPVTAASKKAQVSAKGVVTGDDRGVSAPMTTPPVLTGDDTPSAPEMTPVVMGAAQKEASLSEHQVSETSDDSLRSPSAPVEQPTLVAVESATGDASSTRATGNEPVADVGEKIAADWWKYFTEHHGPITKRGRSSPFVALRDNVIRPALVAGYTETEIKNALLRTGDRDVPDPVPNVQQFQRALSAVRNNVPVNGAPRASNVHHLKPGSADQDDLVRAFNNG